MPLWPMTTDQSAGLRAPPLLSPDQCLFLDFDGTLAELAAHPDAVSVASGLSDGLLELVTALHGAMAVVTGRRLAEVDAYLAPLQLTGAGAHGAEARDVADGVTLAQATAIPEAAVATLREQLVALPDVWLENKSFGVAIHYRQNPAAAAACTDILAAWVEQRNLVLVPGHCVIEARQAGLGKHRAILRLMSLPAFAGRLPVFVGDDAADEDGFAAVQALGGHGIKVGTGSTAANFRLGSVAEVHAWLEASRMAMEQSA